MEGGSAVLRLDGVACQCHWPTRWSSVVAWSSQQLVRDHLVTGRILAQRCEFSVSKDTVQVQVLPGLVCAVKLIAKLLQRHPLNRLRA
jgi:hypothetical protein